VNFKVFPKKRFGCNWGISQHLIEGTQLPLLRFEILITAARISSVDVINV
jgi:hypothetical protein